MEPVVLHLLVVGSYSSALAFEPLVFPPATSTSPDESNVAVWLVRAVAIGPVACHPPMEYSSALARGK